MWIARPLLLLAAVLAAAPAAARAAADEAAPARAEGPAFRAADKAGDPAIPPCPGAPWFWPESARARRGEALARILAPPPPGPRNLVSLGIGGFPVHWCGNAGGGWDQAPFTEEAFHSGHAARLRSGFAALPTFEIAGLAGIEHQEGNRVCIEDVTPWFVQFESRTLVHALLEARLLFPVHTSRRKWFRPDWAGLQEGVFPYFSARIGALWHPSVDAWIDDPTPPAIEHRRTPYYSACLLATWEFAQGLQYRHSDFEIFVELVERQASGPREARGSLLNNRSSSMSEWTLCLGTALRF
jgi:hypothetical protein